MYARRDVECHFIFHLSTVEAIGPFLDHPPLDVNALLHGSLRDKMRTLPSLRALMGTGKHARIEVQITLALSCVSYTRMKLVSPNLCLFRISIVQKLGTGLPLFYDLLTAPATKMSIKHPAIKNPNIFEFNLKVFYAFHTLYLFPTTQS